MDSSALRTRVLEEIGRLPEDRLPGLYDVVHFFRLGLESSKAEPQDVMAFAGSWRDMSDSDFEAFLDEVRERRRRSFSRRRISEALPA